jgi:hypothetical protein
VTAIPLPDRSVDLLICSHVLEHVPDDTLAMREIARVLSDDGLGVVVVPQREGPTEEDPDAPSDERTRRFGQADHVRYYGDDVDERLAAAGLAVSRLRCDGLVAPSLIRVLRLFPWEPVWLVRPARSPHPLPTAAQLRERLPDVLGDAVNRAGVTAAGLRSARDELHPPFFLPPAPPSPCHPAPPSAGNQAPLNETLWPISALAGVGSGRQCRFRRPTPRHRPVSNRRGQACHNAQSGWVPPGRRAPATAKGWCPVRRSGRSAGLCGVATGPEACRSGLRVAGLMRRQGWSRA